jgi:hypothetical protein
MIVYIVFEGVRVYILALWVCLVFYFTQKNLVDPSFCRMELNTIQNFLQKGIHSLFWILVSRGKKKTKKSKNLHPPYEKFGILDRTKHTHKNFSILHFIIPK